MAKKNIEFGIAMLVICVFAYICTFSIKITGNSIISSAVFFPRLIIAITAVLSIILLLTGTRDIKKSDAKEAKNNEGKNYKLLFITMATFVGYGIAVDMLGFVISSIIYLLVQIWCMAEVKKKKDLIKYGIIAVGTSLFIYFVFAYAFFVSLPTGKLLQGVL